MTDPTPPSNSITPKTTANRPVLPKLETASSAFASPKPSPAAALGGEKLIARVADEYTRVLYLAEKAKREGCAVLEEVQWVCRLFF